MPGSTVTAPPANVVDLFAALASIRSPSGEERRVADYITEFAHGLGLDVVEDNSAPQLNGTAGNLLIRLAATARQGTPVVFCAHLDTVPLQGEVDVLRDEVSVRSDGHTILGADNKAAVAVMLAAIRTIVEEEREHAGIELLFTTMEELACRGAKAFDTTALTARVGFVYDHADRIGVYVQSAPCGFLVQLRFAGRPAHAGLARAEGRSAVEAAADAVMRITDVRLDGGATVNVGMIQGGTSHNVVPAECRVVIDVRARTLEAAQTLVREIIEVSSNAARAHGCSVEADLEEKYREYAFAGDEQVVRIAKGALSSCGVEVEAVDANGGADASIFNAQGLSLVNLANGMAQIHTPDEHILIADLEKMLEVTLALVAHAAADRHAQVSGVG